jgi:hypothetical protein
MYFRCDAKSPTKTQHACGSDQFYCQVTGAQYANVLQVPSGHYSTGGAETTRSSHVECEAGFYCVGGKKFGCPAGKWSSAGQTACQLCLPGRYGEANATVNTCTNQCLAGYWYVDMHV